MQITMEQYTASTRALINLAYSGTSAAKTAAQVLLSAFNGEEWQLNINDLSLLDSNHLRHALTFIVARVTLGTEPQELIENGNQVFLDLWDSWNHYNVNNRWKRQCPECYGTGKQYSNMDDDNDLTTEICINCNGTSYVSEGVYA
ncbi:hypothetical protein [Endozoicomonas montiporae]|uniref:DUF7673 domain-containing protein n=1 Tax=Endozoicomonas montiporae CL-33 TaxID=570277 RepID=A0A142BCV3_9GAMM|nr:hypothetical protein [Endozoicomonas montiporae]AMO56579.1 hypothetical protein EZMO1_2497 [Endozoicomonas montiporae CL-33]